MKKLLTFLLGMTLLCIACSNKSPEQSSFIDIQDSSDNMRYQTPEGSLGAADIAQHIQIELANRFPLWQESVSAAVDLSFKNTSKAHMPARMQPRLFVYSIETQKPLYWSNIDLSYGRSGQRGMLSVISIPVGASHDVVIPIQATQWAPVDTQNWPETAFHSQIPSGKYLMRFEGNIVDDQDHPVTTIVSNFIEFETVASGQLKP